MATVHVDDEALGVLKSSLLTSGEDYKSDYKALTNIVEAIKNGSIEGQAADKLLQLYEDKKEIFQGVADTIDEAESYMGVKTNTFDNMVDELMTKDMH